MKKIFFFVFFTSALAFSQNYTEYITGSSADVTTNHEFGICMMGGASENDNAMIWFLNRANGGDVVVLRASGSDGYNNYMYSELGVSINSVRTFVIDNEVGATDPYVLDKVMNAEAIWFAGGDQYNYVSYFKDNAMEDALNIFINSKRGVIGGTSAGMAILGSVYFSAENGTVTNAQALSNPYDNRVALGYNDCLEIPFLEGVITDTHYDDPDRRGRHSAFLVRFATDNNSEVRGIACNEYTAVCIDEFGVASVYGDYPNYPEYAYFLRSNCAEDFLPETCESGQPLTWNQGGEAIRVAKIPGTQSGQNFIDLGDWSYHEGVQWENWVVNTGSFANASTTDANCDLLGVTESVFADINVSPNPFTNYIKISNLEYEYEATMYDVLGNNIDVHYSEYNKIDTSRQASGIYFLTIDLGDIKQTFKLLKE